MHENAMPRDQYHHKSRIVYNKFRPCIWTRIVDLQTSANFALRARCSKVATAPPAEWPVNRILKL